MYKPTRYTEIDSVGNDFLAIQDALMNGESDIDPIDYSCIYGRWLVEYDLDGMVYVTELGPNRDELPKENAYWDDRTSKFDCTGCTSDTDLFHFFRNQIKPLIIL